MPNKFIVILFILSLFTTIVLLLVIKRPEIFSPKPPLSPGPSVTKLPDTARELPTALKRLDKNEEELLQRNYSERVVHYRSDYNTIDEEGKIFMTGLYKTTSGKVLIVGYATTIKEEKNQIKLELTDEFDYKIEKTIQIPLNQEHKFNLGVTNTENSLDFRLPVAVKSKEPTEIINRLIGKKVVVELEKLESNDGLGIVLYIDRKLQ